MKILDPIKSSQSFSINIVHTKLTNFQLLDNQPLLTTLFKLIKSSDKFYQPIEINILLNGLEAAKDLSALTKLFLDIDSETRMKDTGVMGVKHISLTDNFSKNMIKYSSSAHLGTADGKIELCIWVIDDLEFDRIIFPLGTARDILAHLSSYPWYINVDEDDNLISIHNLIKLQSTIKSIKNPIALFGFRWNYFKIGQDEKMWLHSKMNPLDPTYWREVPKDNDGNDLPMTYNKYDDGRGLCSWNIFHNQEYYDAAHLVRPAVNKYDDCLFYSKLLLKIPNVTFIQLMIYDYHQEHGTMNKEKDPWSDTAMEYITDQSFTIDQIIEFENEYYV